MGDHSRVRRGCCSYKYCKNSQERRNVSEPPLNASGAKTNEKEMSWLCVGLVVSVPLSDRQLALLHLCLALTLSRHHQVRHLKTAGHRRRINTEEKAKVVTAVWGTDFMQFLDVLAVLH